MTAVVGVPLPCLRCDRIRPLEPSTELCPSCHLAERISRTEDRMQDERRLSARALETMLGLVPA